MSATERAHPFSFAGYVSDEIVPSCTQTHHATLPNGIVGSYAWDAASQLTGLTYALGGNTLGNLTYTYDAAGNRTSVGGTWARTGLPQALASATYDAGDRITSWNGQPFSYDANGNLASDGPTSYLWNARNQLSSLAGGASASFVYDGVGRRQAKTVNGTTINFLYDGVNSVQELVGGAPTANLLTGGIDENFLRGDAAGSWTFLPDALGSTLALTDSSGTSATQYTYEPFGATTITGAGSNNPAQFTGRENDGTGLYYYRTRFYSTGMQRYVAEDSLGFVGDASNLYRYVGDSPITLRDPTGRCPWCIVLIPPALEALGEAAVWTAGTIGALAAGEEISKHLFPPDRKCGKNKNEACDAQYEADIAVCRAIRSRACYEQAAERYAACLAGRPLPPFPFRRPQ